MSLRTTAAAPFKEKGRESLPESEFVVALSINWGWFTPDQAKRLVDVAVGEGFLVRNDDDLVATFDPDEVTVPEGFTPDEELLRERSTFERVLDSITSTGVDKQEAVAAINRRQADLAVSIEAAAVLYAHGRGVDVRADAKRARTELRGE